MAQNLLQRVEVTAVLQVVGGKGVPEQTKKRGQLVCEFFTVSLLPGVRKTAPTVL